MEFVLKNPVLLLVAVVILTSMVALCILWLLPALIKRGVNVSGTIEKADMAIATLDTLTDTIKALFPNTLGLELIDKILGYAHTAVDSAEQLYKTSQIPENRRKAEATKLVYTCLQSAGVTVTEDMKKIIDGAIEAAVYALPKTHNDEEVGKAMLSDFDDHEESGLLTD